MLRNLTKLGCAAIAGLALTTAAAIPAQAGATFNLNFTFTDGRTATGSFTVSDYNNGLVPEYLDNTWNVTTTSAGGFIGHNYIPDINPGFFAGNTILILNRPGYFGFLSLHFNVPLDGTVTGPVNLPDVYDMTGSYECYQGYADENAEGCSGEFAQQTFIAGTPVPEPATIGVLGLGLLAAGAFGRRRAKNAKA